MMSAAMIAMMSTWTPPMGGDCVAWLKSSHETTVTGAGVSAWGNLAGTATFTQGTDAERPPINATGINTSRPTLTFPTGKSLAHTLSLAPPCTFAMVAKSSAAGGYAAAYCGGGLFVYGQEPADSGWGCFAGANVVGGGAIADFTSCIVLARAYNDMDLRTDGSSVTRATGVASYDPASFIGQGGAGVQYLEGEIAEVIAFSAVKSVAVATRIEAMQAIEYAL